ncbi:MAG: hypothetical protein U1G05_13110 [Kiritimatiellia bacterium]
MKGIGKALVVTGWAVFASFNILDIRQHGYRDPLPPADVLKQYVSAMRGQDYDRALDCLLLTDVSQSRDSLRFLLPELSEKMNRGDWDVSIVDNAQSGRFATILYSTRKGRNDIEPILLVRDESENWKLYHSNTSGGLARVAFSEKDMADASAMIGWGETRMRELRLAAK